MISRCVDLESWKRERTARTCREYRRGANLGRYTRNDNDYLMKVKHGFDYHADYYPDLITNDSIRFLHESRQHYKEQPFLLVMSYPAPHGPEDSAPQYSNLFFNVTRHRTPSYDFAPNPDKQWILRWVRLPPVANWRPILLANLHC